MIGNIKGWLINEKKSIINGVVLFVIIVILWDLFGTDISSDSGAIDATRTELGNVGAEQQSAIDGLEKLEDGLDSSARQVDNISEGITDATADITDIAEDIGRSEGVATSSADIITSCKRIFEDIRATGKDED